MTEDSKKIILKYHSTIRIEHPSTTWLGRILQRMRILTKQVKEDTGIRLFYIKSLRNDCSFLILARNR